MIRTVGNILTKKPTERLLMKNGSSGEEFCWKYNRKAATVQALSKSLCCHAPMVHHWGMGLHYLFLEPDLQAYLKRKFPWVSGTPIKHTSDVASPNTQHGTAFACRQNTKVAITTELVRNLPLKILQSSG